MSDNDIRMDATEAITECRAAWSDYQADGERKDRLSRRYKSQHRAAFVAGWLEALEWAGVSLRDFEYGDGEPQRPHGYMPTDREATE